MITFGRQINSVYLHVLFVTVWEMYLQFFLPPNCFHFYFLDLRKTNLSLLLATLFTHHNICVWSHSCEVAFSGCTRCVLCHDKQESMNESLYWKQSSNPRWKTFTRKAQTENVHWKHSTLLGSTPLWVLLRGRRRDGARDWRKTHRDEPMAFPVGMAQTGSREYNKRVSVWAQTEILTNTAFSERSPGEGSRSDLEPERDLTMQHFGIRHFQGINPNP